MFLPRTSALLQIAVAVIPRILAATDLSVATPPDSTSQKPLQPSRTLMYSSKQFQDEYELGVDTEFEWNGSVAEWAPGQSGPRLWGDEDELIRPGDANDSEEGPETNYCHGHHSRWSLFGCFHRLDHRDLRHRLLGVMF